MGGTKDELAARIDQLNSRLFQLEQRFSIAPPPPVAAATRDSNGRSRFCAVPRVPERQFGPEVSLDRARLIRVLSKKWVNGTVLKYYLFDEGPWAGPKAQRDAVEQAFDVWENVGIGIKFEKVDAPENALVRIGFLDGDGSWSYVGRDVLQQGKQERTMNIGWDIAHDIDTAVHEIGHTLGFPHEHQNPNAGIVWDEDAVYADLGGPPNNWSREMIEWNILRKIPPESIEGSPWDPHSIMHYPFKAGLIREPERYRIGIFPAGGLSANDIQMVKFFYPLTSTKNLAQLRPLESQLLAIKPGDQKDFIIEPSESREYSIRTFGQSDTVIVLFEDDNGTLRYIQGNDDSGTDDNALLKQRLTRGRKYVLRIRLYYASNGGDISVMVW